MCPSNLQNPLGKLIPVSVFGAYPYVIIGKDKKLAGGTEFQVIDIYAKKFGFTPKFMKGKGFDNEGSVADMVRIFFTFFLFNACTTHTLTILCNR